MRIGDILGFINSRIILGLVFAIILIPTSIILKIFKYDPLKISFNSKKSYFEKIKKNKIDLNTIF